MRASFSKADAPDQVVGQAEWLGPEVRIEGADDSVKDVLRGVFRPTPVVVDDPSLRPAGTSGGVELPPGSLEWFLAAARVRGADRGLKVVFEPSGSGVLGWDPAGTYRPLARQVERMHRPA
jgi:hypothetical protein